MQVLRMTIIKHEKLLTICQTNKQKKFYDNMLNEFLQTVFFNLVNILLSVLIRDGAS